MTRRTLALLAVLALVVALAIGAVMLARWVDVGPSKLQDRRGKLVPSRQEIRQEQPELARAAVVVLEPVGDSGVSGTATLVELTSGEGVRIELSVTGLSAGLHGIAVRELGDCAAPGDHFNPEHVQHAGPAALVGHAGDLGNVVAARQGRDTNATLISRRVSLAPGARRIMGRSLVVHEGPDDMVSQPDGMAGRVIACGVIEPAR